jgi:hypothetical protein
MKLAVALSVLLVGAVPAQDVPKFNKPKPKVAKEITKSPVTHAEAKQVFEKAWKALSQGLKNPRKFPLQLPNDKLPIKKNEVLSAFTILITAFEPQFRRTPRPTNFKVQRLRKDVIPGTQQMVSKGFVSPYGPLTTGTNSTLTPKEFGTAVGILMVRITDLSHMPSSKFSPSLMPG